MIRRAARLRAEGFSVLLFDFQAHGESPGHWIDVSAAGEIFIGSLTGNVFRWYPGWMQGVAGSEEGLRPNNEK